MKRPARLGLELCWGTAPGANLKDLLVAAASQGFVAVTASPPMYERTVEQGIAGGELRRIMADLDMSVSFLDPLMDGLPGMPNIHDVPASRRPVFSYSEDECYRIAEALDVRAMNLPHSLGSPVPLEIMADAFGRICERARSHGLDATLEFVPGTGISDLQASLDILSAVNATNAGVMFDTWHFARSGGHPNDLRGLIPGWLGGLQVSDRVEPPADEAYVPMSGRRLPGEGELPLVEIVGPLVRDHPEVNIGIEVFSDELRELAPSEVSRRAAVTTRSLTSQIAARAARESETT